MKAPKSKLASIIQNDSKGAIELRNFISSGKSECVITLSNGKKYKIFSK